MNKASLIYCFICLSLLLCCSFGAVAQEDDPVPTSPDFDQSKPPAAPVLDEEKLDDLPVETIVVPDKLDPGKAAFFSAVLPGLGQAYNGSHWKIPLIYVGGAFVIYSVNFNNRLYSTALRNLSLFNVDPDAAANLGRPQSSYKREVDHYRRNRDYSIILGSFLYGLNILDAYVDAHLQDFDINDDLAVRVKPALFANPGGQSGTGIALTLHFK